jgi:tRNA(Arg) A34 adenosine deaminase TadA
MCTHALNYSKIKYVYFGQFNDKFGGCGSVLKHNEFPCEGGFFA